MSHEMIHMTDELLVKYLLGECNAQESGQVEAWLELNEENKTYYNQIRHIWDESKSLSDAPEISTEESWQRLKRKLESAPAKPVFKISRIVYYAAASVLLAIGLFALYNYRDEKVPAKTEIVSVQKPATILEAKKEIRVDTLSDKSIVTLNKNASLKFPEVFEEKERRVALQGEAFFNITPNKEKPFFIDASNDVEIRVVGTSFNVKSFDAYTEVIVETGIVEVKKFNRVVLLHPKEKARIDKDDSTIVVQKNTDKLYKYFRSKQFECDNTPLWKVVEVLNEAYGDSVVIGRNELKSMTMTASFDNQSLETILEIISETFDIKVEKKGAKYILK